MCKKCGCEYIDPRCHELVLEGMPQVEFSISHRIILLVIGVLITLRGYYLFGMHMLNTPDSMQWLMPTVISILGIALILGAVIDLFLILTGIKQKKYKRLLDESRIRMQDETYVAKLKAMGYIR